MKKIQLIITILLLNSYYVFATDLVITNYSFTGNVRDSNLSANFTVSWNNAWYNNKNHDGVWVFFKLRHQNDLRTHKPVAVKISGHEMIYNYAKNNVEPSFYIPTHRAGIMIFLSKKYRGNVSWRVKVELDVAQTRGIDFSNAVFGEVVGIEMVQIPKGPFYSGDADTAAQNTESALYDFVDKSRYLINSEKSLSIGKNKGSLYYNNNNTPHFRGDMNGPVSDSFPKGYREFYIMKYEMTQGNYTAFLNSLSNQPSFFRANFGGKEYYNGRGSIKIENGIYVCANPERPANYTSWDDGCAFADWAGLRPLTELEFEKAARGPNNTDTWDYPWGRSSSELVSRYYNKQGDLVYEGNILEKDLNDNNLELYGASYYWVMDLGGSLWERVATIGSSKGRSFKGTQGDGVLDQFGNATNPDWPNENDGGFGYRGGGYYDFGMALGPSHTPISARRYGSWGDGPRSVAYGFRAGLTIE